MQQYNQDHFVLHSYTKKRKRDLKKKNIINAVCGQGLANNYDKQIQGQTNFRSNLVMLKYK